MNKKSEKKISRREALTAGTIAPEDVAAVLFLVSDEGRFLTGAAIDVAAGSNARWQA